MIIKAELTQEEKEAIAAVASMECDGINCIDCPANIKEGEKCLKDYAQEAASKNEVTKTKKLYCYTNAGRMEGHKYSDDVAICEADSIKEATKIFGKMYDYELLKGNVKEVNFNKWGIFVATDY